jgi:RHS repeat-associated protein
MTFDGSTLKTGILDTAGYPLSYAYDAENRLTTVYNRDYRVELTYDYLGRRVRQVTKTNDSALTIKQDLRFVYDGWHMIATLKATTSGSATTYALANAYLWGLDVSGTRGGAGGIGGLLAWYDFTAAKSYAPCYDGRGNVSLVYGLTDAHVISEYEYDPYGRNLRTTGYAYASGAWGMVSYDPVNNPFRYQTKWHLQGAIGVGRDYGFTQFDIYDYGKRWYHPKQGRFINRDPIGEKGGRNLYGYVGNDPVNGVDVLGMVTQDQYNTHVNSLLNDIKQYTNYKYKKGENSYGVLSRMLKSGNFNMLANSIADSSKAPFALNNLNTAIKAYYAKRGAEECAGCAFNELASSIYALKGEYGSWNAKTTGEGEGSGSGNGMNGNLSATPAAISLPSKARCDELAAKYKNELNAWNGASYDDEDTALRAMLTNAFRGNKKGYEYASHMFYKGDGTYYVTAAFSNYTVGEGTISNANLVANANSTIDGDRVVADVDNGADIQLRNAIDTYGLWSSNSKTSHMELSVHTHPNNSFFSTDDYDLPNYTKAPSVVIGPDGSISYFKPYGTHSDVSESRVKSAIPAQDLVDLRSCEGKQ